MELLVFIIPILWFLLFELTHSKSKNNKKEPVYYLNHEKQCKSCGAIDNKVKCSYCKTDKFN